MDIYSIFIERDGQKIRLPVNPGELPTARNSDNGEYNVLGIGPIMQPRTPALREVTISSLFPGRPAPYFQPYLWDGFHEPEYYINFLDGAMTDRAVVQYIPVRSYENGAPYGKELVGFPALVTGFTYTEKGGETGDFYYDLTLTEYRNYSPVTMQMQSPATATTPAEVTTEKQRDIPKGQLYAGCSCIANGDYYYTSYGDEPHGSANGRQVVVSRIVDLSRPCPIHITTPEGGALGWIAQNGLTTT